MNCKPDDIARVVVPPGFKRTLQDKFVTVVGCIPGHDDICQRAYGSPRGGVWLCVFATPFMFHHNGSSWMVKQAFLLDSWLRPIRDQPGDDETLTWAGKPEHVAPRAPVTQG